MKSSRGFTTIELLIVIAIMVVLAALAIPSFADFFEKSRLRGAAEMVYEQLMFAKSQAIKRSKPITVQFSVAGNIPWAMGITDEDTSCNEGTVTSCAILDYNNDGIADDNVSMFITDAEFTNVVATHTFGGDSSGFEPLRGAALGGASSVGEVVLTSDKYEVHVSVSEAGSITLCSPTTSETKNKLNNYPDC